METSVTPNPVRILIVDDHPNTANMLARVLSHFEVPVEIITASSGDDALAKLDNRVADVLITDFMMPGMNGLELIEHLKGDQKPAHTILITAYDTPGLVITARRLNVQDYLVKPVQPEKIRSIVAKVIDELRPKPSPALPVAAARRSFKILIADDYPDNLRLLSTRLQSEGYTFMAAWDGEEALHMVYTEDPDLVLLDVNMPKKDGFQVLAAMRADPTVAHIPVIMITAARIGPRDVREGLTLGADDYVIKPFDWRELAARIQSKLRVKQAEDILRRRTKELGILPEIGQELSAQLNIEDVANIVLNRIVEALGASARLDVLDSGGEAYCRQRLLGQLTPATLALSREQAAGWGANAHVLATRQGVVVENTRHDSWWRIEGDSPGSAVVAPLLGRHRAIGALTIFHAETGHFNIEHQTLLQAIASQAAIAIENAQLFDVEHRRVQELMGLNEISQEINRFTHSRQLLDNLPRLIQERLGYPTVALWTQPGERAELELCSLADGAQNLSDETLCAAPQQALAGNAPALLSQPNRAPSAAAVPLVMEGRLRAALAIYSPIAHAFQESDVALLQALAIQVTAALDRVALFESVEHEQRRLLAVLHSAADAILVLDGRTCLTLANPAGERLFSDAESVVGQPLPLQAGYDDLLALLERGRSLGAHQQGEVSWPDGRTFSALVTSIDEGGQVIVLHDISQFKALADLKNEYIATASHDLKNPIMAVLGYNDLLVKVGPLNEMQVEFSHRIHNATNQMRDLVLNLLEISRLESGTAMKLEALDVNALLQEGAEALRDQASAKNQALDLEFCPERPIIRGDRMLLQQLINNLLGNAIKYTPVDGKIVLSTRLNSPQIDILFKDSGIGIPADDLPYIFNKFYRVANDDTKDIEGTGLGLAIVKSIVENHAGSITVDSQPGKGTVFTVHLPLVRLAEASVETN